jgi:hypothetical protein
VRELCVDGTRLLMSMPAYTPVVVLSMIRAPSAECSFHWCEQVAGADKAERCNIGVRRTSNHTQQNCNVVFVERVN